MVFSPDKDKDRDPLSGKTPEEHHREVQEKLERAIATSGSGPGGLMPSTSAKVRQDVEEARRAIALSGGNSDAAAMEAALKKIQEDQAAEQAEQQRQQEEQKRAEERQQRMFQAMMLAALEAAGPIRESTGGAKEVNSPPQSGLSIAKVVQHSVAAERSA